MKILKKVFAVALSAVLTFSLTGCGGAENVGSSSSGSDSSSVSSSSGGSSENIDLIEVPIGIPVADATAVMENAGIAEKLGYLDEELEKAGYKANIIGFGQGGTAVNEAFSSGQVKISFIGDIPPIVGVSNGINLETFASLNSDSEMGIVVGNDTNIQTIKDLKGKKIVAAFGTVTYVYLQKLLEANGLSVDDVEVINDIANGGTLVASGDADAVVSSGTGIYLFERSGIGKILVSSKTDKNLSAMFFAVGDKNYLSENEEVAKAIIRALIRSKDEFERNTEAVYGILDSENTPKELWAQIYPESDGFEKFEPYIADSTKDKFNKTCKILKDYGVISKDVSAEDIYNNAYAAAVYEEQGRDIPK